MEVPAVSETDHDAIGAVNDVLIREDESAGIDDEPGARAVFAAIGIQDTARQIDPNAPPTNLAYPVALKAASKTIAHKTEAGAVALNIVERFSEEGDSLQLRQKDYSWVAAFGKHPECRANTAATAICLAALRARNLAVTLGEGLLATSARK